MRPRDLVPSTPADVWASGDAYEPYVGRWSRLVAREFLALITTPLLARFRFEIRGASERWSSEVSEALSMLNDRLPAHVELP